MPMSNDELAELLRLVGLTREREINCEQCLALVAEFVDQELAGKSVHEGLQAVRQHLEVCAECCEEYEALRRALSELEDS